MGEKMKLHEGTWYSPADLEAKLERDKAAAKRARAESGVADIALESQIGDEPIGAFVARVVSEALEPLEKRITDLSEQVDSLSAAFEAVSKGASAPVGAEGGAPVDPDSEKAAEGDSDESPADPAEEIPAAPTKPARGGRTGKAPAAGKDGA